MDLNTLPNDPLDRLRAYQRAREEEEERVNKASKKPPSERTEADWIVLSYSPFGTANSCGY